MFSQYLLHDWLQSSKTVDEPTEMKTEYSNYTNAHECIMLVVDSLPIVCDVLLDI